MRLAGDGFHVFATVRRPADGAALARADAGTVSWTIMDVTDPDTIADTSRRVSDHVGDWASPGPRTPCMSSTSLSVRNEITGKEVMYAVIRHYRMGAGTIDAMARKVETEFADRIPEEVGSLLYTAIDTGDATATTITAFPDEATFRRSMPAVAEVQASVAEEFEVEEITLLHGDVLVSRGSAAMAEPIHYAGK